MLIVLTTDYDAKVNVMLVLMPTARPIPIQMPVAMLILMLALTSANDNAGQCHC